MRFRLLALSIVLGSIVPVAANAAVSTRQAPINGLVGYWSFDENGNTAKDRSASNLNMTLTNVTHVLGKRRGAITLGADNATAITATTNILNNDVHTISFWFRQNGTVGNWAQVFKYAPAGTDRSPAVWTYVGGGTCLHWKYDAGNTGYDCFGPGGASTNFTLGQWYHLTSVKNGATLTMYVNGVSVGSTTVANPKAAGNAALSVGDAGWGSARISMDELRIYNRALGASEVRKLYDSYGTAVRAQATHTGLVGGWTFDEGQGTKTHDTSGKNNIGTLTNGPGWTDGKHGKALYFDGSNDFVSIPTTTGLSGNLPGVSVSAWVRAADFDHANYPHILSATGNMIAFHGLGPAYGGNKGKVGFYVNNNPGSCNVTSTTILQLGKWYHITAVYNASNSKIYVNGVLEGTNGSCAVGAISAFSSMRIGTYFGTTSDTTWKGNLDDVRIHNRALTQAEITAMYGAAQTMINAPQNAKYTNGLTGLWSFDGKDVVGTTAYDRSGGGNNGTLVNTPKPAIGKIGQALAFDGTNKYSQAQSATLGTVNQTYSISAWVKLNPGVTAGSILHVSSQSDGAGWCLDMLGVSGGKAITYSWVTSQAQGTTTLSPGKWYLVTGTWSSANGLRIYLNGTLEATTAQGGFSAAGTTVYASVGWTYVGCASSWGYMNGTIDDVRIYNRELTGTEVRDLYRLGQ